MGFLLDTCLLSEAWKPSPNVGVVRWLSESAEDELFLSVLSLGEVWKGIGRLPDGKKRQKLVRDYVVLRSRFASRILPVDASVAENWGDIAADANRAGRAVHVVDGLLAATAHVFGLVVVTRNIADFEMTPAPLLNPWT